MLDYTELMALECWQMKRTHVNLNVCDKLSSTVRSFSDFNQRVNFEHLIQNFEHLIQLIILAVAGEAAGTLRMTG